MFLIDDLLLAPVNGFKFILGQIQKMADQELNDDSVIKDQLLELQMRYELEEISDEDFKVREAELFARLRVIKLRQLDLLHEATAHTAESSSFVIEVGGDEGDVRRTTRQVKRYQFFGGKGGVGKTTAASATALFLLNNLKQNTGTRCSSPFFSSRLIPRTRSRIVSA